MTRASTICRCNHEHAAHEHYRPGSDCGICGPQGCASFSAAPASAAPPVSRRVRTALLSRTAH